MSNRSLFVEFPDGSNDLHRVHSSHTINSNNQYLDIEAWYITEVKQALIEADTDDFATDSQVAFILSKFDL